MSFEDKIVVRVAAIETLSPKIKEFRLEADTPLQPYSPGAHVVVEMQDGKEIYRNAYSLVSKPGDDSAYHIAVRLQDDSRGGSRFMHGSVAVGDELKISPPANLFAPNWMARKHVMLAGGVGITPFTAYLPEMVAKGAEFELHYMFRSGQTGAYGDELVSRYGACCSLYDSDQGDRCDLQQVLLSQPLGTHFYICGPESLLQAVKETAEALGIPASALNWEEFAGAKPGEPFVLEIKGRSETLQVDANSSMLETLEAANIEIPNLCRGGVCGQCICTVAEGDIEHRDSFLSDSEKMAGNVVMPCVSRAAGDKLVLEI